jgi:ParB-like chromosome segregation protein Spo0J
VGTQSCRVVVDELRSDFSPRNEGLNVGHVEALAELSGDWPPILVWRETCQILDGNHRVAAARLLGLREVSALFFDGTAADAFVESVRRNVEHGLPLTLDERRAAAQRVLNDHPEWSNRRLAKVCGLAPNTLGRLRATLHPTRAAPDESRIGLDGRPRLVTSERQRRQILDAVEANPDASLRSIAHAVGTSPETVRRIRTKVAQRDSPRQQPTTSPSGSPRPSTTEIAPFDDPEMQSRRDHGPFTGDVALMSTPNGTTFATWFDCTDQSRDWRTHLLAVPLSRVYEVADEARRRARDWIEFAEALEGRVHLTS